MLGKPIELSIKNPADISSENGMDLRDYFAAKAMQGQMVNAPIFGIPNSESDYVVAVAKNAYAVADAMLKTRGA